MPFLENFKSVIATEYMRCLELTIDIKYPILSVQNAYTKYGYTVRAATQDYKDINKQFHVYLPEHYTWIFSDNELRHFTPDELDIVYKEKRDQPTFLDITQ